MPLRGPSYWPRAAGEEGQVLTRVSLFGGVRLDEAFAVCCLETTILLQEHGSHFTRPRVQENLGCTVNSTFFVICLLS